MVIKSVSTTLLINYVNILQFFCCCYFWGVFFEYQKLFLSSLLRVNDLYILQRWHWTVVFTIYSNDINKADFVWQEVWRTDSFIRDSLEWPFSELCFSDASLRNQYKFITFSIFSCKTLIICCKILIITVISNKTTNELTIFETLRRKVTIFYRQELTSLCQVQKKLRACRNSIQSFWSSSFIANDSHINIICPYIVVLCYLVTCHFVYLR